MRDLESRDVRTAAALARDADPPDVERPSAEDVSGLERPRSRVRTVYVDPDDFAPKGKR